MSEKTRLDLSDFEIAMLIIERDTAQFKAARFDELLNQYGREKALIDAEDKEPPTTRTESFVSETTFKILKFDPQRGERLGEFEIAYEASNIPDKFSHAYGILRKNNATIKSRYHGPDYEFSYWLYGEGKIYRQQRKQP